MADRLYHRLSWHAWLAHLDALARACAGASVNEAAEMVRELNTLLHRAPSAACHDGMIALDPLRLEALLDFGMADGAVLQMLAPETGFIASRGRGDNHFVSIALPEAAREESAFGASLALAGVRAAIVAMATPMTAVATPHTRVMAVAGAVH